MDDTLLILSFHGNHFGNIPLLSELYGDFPHKLFYGNSRLPSSCSDAVLVDMGSHANQQAHGIFAYRAMVHAMKTHPGYAGYLFLEDDCVLNTWNMKDKARDRIWSSPAALERGRDVVTDTPSPDDWWGWWARPVGAQACQRAWAELSAERRRMLEKNLRVANAFTAGLTDCFYVPAHARDAVIETLGVMSACDVFSEFAVSTSLLAVEDASRHESLSALYLTERGRRFWAGLYSEKLDVIHPVKLSERGDAELLRSIFKLRKQGSHASFFHPAQRARRRVWWAWVAAPILTMLRRYAKRFLFRLHRTDDTLELLR